MNNTSNEHTRVMSDSTYVTLMLLLKENGYCPSEANGLLWNFLINNVHLITGKRERLIFKDEKLYDEIV